MTIMDVLSYIKDFIIGILDQIENYKEELYNLFYNSFLGILINIIASFIAFIFFYPKEILLNLPKNLYYTPNPIVFSFIIAIFPVVIPIIFIFNPGKLDRLLDKLPSKVDWFYNNFSEINWNFLFYFVGYYSVTLIILFEPYLIQLKELLGISIVNTLWELFITLIIIISTVIIHKVID